MAFAAVVLQGAAVICLIAAASSMQPWLHKMGKYGDFHEDNCVQQIILKTAPEGIKLQAQVVVGSNGWYQARALIAVVPLQTFVRIGGREDAPTL